MRKTGKFRLISPRMIKKRSMSSTKRMYARTDIFAFYIGRPLSYILTIPFLYTKISPNMISVLSLFPLAVSFILFYIARDIRMLILGWCFLFLWNLLDGVDGNVARYRNQTSKLGSVYDAMSGYAASVTIFFSAGVAASHNPGLFQEMTALPIDLYIVIGGLSAIFSIFPRLVLHKAISAGLNSELESRFTNRSAYGIVKIIGLNLISAAGFLQVIILTSIMLRLLDFITVAYFLINLCVMFASVKSILVCEEERKEEEGGAE